LKPETTDHKIDHIRGVELHRHGFVAPSNFYPRPEGALYVQGHSCLTMAVELNCRGAPSSGSSWNDVFGPDTTTDPDSRQFRQTPLWAKLNPDPEVEEVIRNYPIRQPVLWVAEQQPGHVDQQRVSAG
jgi:hypothetical protein